MKYSLLEVSDFESKFTFIQITIFWIQIWTIELVKFY